MRKVLIGLLGVVLLAGCATGPFAVSTREQNRVPVGSTLVLSQPVQVPAWQQKAYFQDGKAMVWHQVNIYRSHCALALDHKAETPQSIEPDRFQVTDVSTEYFFKQVRRHAPEPQIQPAGFGSPLPVGMTTRSDGGMTYEVLAMVLALNSPRQPDVVSLVCADWGLPQDTMHINLNKIRQSLGELGRLEIAARP